MAEPIRVLMVWRHRVLGEAVAASLRGRTEVEVVAAAGEPGEAERILGRTPVDVVLVDASLEPAVAVEITHLLRDRYLGLQVLPFGLPREEDAVPFIEAGAGGFLCREASLDEVVEAVTGAARGLAPSSLPLAARVARRIEELDLGRRQDRRGGEAAAADFGLTEREEEVLGAIARGLSNKEIAHRLGIRTATVKNHVHAVLVKLGVRRRREAVRLAYETGLLQGPFRWRPLDEEE
jgi:DNA-binding NarL/FixJ family response regulator